MEPEERTGEPRIAPSPGPRIIPAESIPASRLDQDALRVISRLQRHEFEAYFVGGCVRDLLIGRIPKDFDVATSAHPRQIRRLFRNARIIGRRFRLAHITYGDHVVETATFRREPDLSNAEEPAVEGAPEASDDGAAAPDDLLITLDNVFGTAEQDAQRRDFTFNALFLDPTRGLIIDYVGGLDDLEAGVLRTIGDPEVRMAEDPVRILRAVKFATRLSFRIEERTWAAMQTLAPQLARAAPPRVLEEVLRLLRSGAALGAMRMLRACSALEIVLPEIDAFLTESEATRGPEETDTFWRLLEALDNDVHAGYVPSTPVCLALLFLPMIEREAERSARPGQPPDLLQTAMRVLEPVSMNKRIARRDFSRAVRILERQRRFTQPASRHFRPLLFVLGEEFPEALELFRLRAAARGQGWDIYEGWRARRELALSAPPEEIDAERRAARRRGRRRRSRSRGPKGPAAEPPE
ncbi:MAG TPA: polynucleotide adenylyltransferase PcnB [Planctomycetota bacterium]|jgi:poly(A) polymerase|nr:polynucleotide adenylyltransferase PcnB [Planctomycetota bacterium]